MELEWGWSELECWSGVGVEIEWIGPKSQKGATKRMSGPPLPPPHLPQHLSAGGGSVLGGGWAWGRVFGLARCFGRFEPKPPPTPPTRPPPQPPKPRPQTPEPPPQNLRAGSALIRADPR